MPTTSGPGSSPARAKLIGQRVRKWAEGGVRPSREVFPSASPRLASGLPSAPARATAACWSCSARWQRRRGSRAEFPGDRVGFVGSRGPARLQDLVYTPRDFSLSALRNFHVPLRARSTNLLAWPRIQTISPQNGIRRRAQREPELSLTLQLLRVLARRERHRLEANLLEGLAQRWVLACGHHGRVERLNCAFRRARRRKDAVGLNTTDLREALLDKGGGLAGRVTASRRKRRS